MIDASERSRGSKEKGYRPDKKLGLDLSDRTDLSNLDKLNLRLKAIEKQSGTF